ncbi:UDP-GalNAc:beta-1,3-N-acetylgalactosaminyltransferase 2-like isoform X1 [Homarus americanus]|uniref:Hexosyltransferase n=1 Tax=Homarus americanus TaxID=6706 RepID=A0A8J5MUP4_HOMAM|nr:UDP-GalNAc:beta-1,3-N-acetylgalactosaminyltransferase 2-like isoform X1 [Homarus americanus]XP_042231591.1 UDP-GalNAc:beta-1,3-N-acetylgalactosaminyltransferase 2-like isoform X1 [Homarus americanus]XP_042231592.1 UDP-GalNAc:beta-1,3-N-acetylgalactosaminyltransferase 2-like isoform X1 [Homarus americanus]KAG7163654.1 UDP-GalNAc:beta-1-3-N-acetylgalactosaminyltransferase 2-like [Homarus americanus]
MERRLCAPSLVIILIALVTYIVRVTEIERDVGVTSKRLVVGVISARDHVSHRHAIRHTWGSLVQDIPDMELVFVLGETDCAVHPADRISSYTCQRWHVNEEIERSEVQSFFKSKNLLINSSLRDSECYIGLGFRVLHPIIVEEISVRANLMKRANNIFILLQDAEEVIERVQLKDKICSEEDGYCNIKLLAPLHLPKEFEGELRVYKKGEDGGDVCGEELFSLQSGMKWVCEWTNSSLVEYKFVRTRKNVVTKWRGTSCPLASVKFNMADKNVMLKHIKEQHLRMREWKSYLDDLQMKIENEEKEYQDVLTLPLMDVYSHLPHKVLTFLKWVTHKYNSSFIMKVDDDTFVNISLLDLLTKNEVYSVPTWWSQFQHHRSVPMYGKWADTEYPSLTYPTFPSGAGYLMTGSLAQTLATAGSYLTAYGGEDVSMGIWVASVAGNSKTVDVPCWLPHPHCSQTILLQQLSATEMRTIWNKMKLN